MVNVLVIGSGGREHAIGWKLGQSKEIDKVFHEKKLSPASENPITTINLYFSYATTRIGKQKNLKNTIISIFFTHTPCQA